jgi:hypothetical protein
MAARGQIAFRYRMGWYSLILRKGFTTVARRVLRGKIPHIQPRISRCPT